MGTWSTLVRHSLRWFASAPRLTLFAPQACNIGDFSRYSKKESSAWMQMLFVPALWCTTSLFGAISSNMTQAICEFRGLLPVLSSIKLTHHCS